ncbi:MAG: DNA repair protein RecO [Phycisphaerales bacterium]|nr:DNA repair protein RecO [Phycisphaerales bacterium]
MSFVIDVGIVLRLSDYSETSQIVTLLTRGHGVARLLAKGTRRTTKDRFMPGLDLLELGETRFKLARPDAGLGTLAEWKQQSAYPRIRSDLARVYAATYATEATLATTTEHDPHPALFDALAALLQTLDIAGEPLTPDGVTIELVRFVSELLREVGFMPTMRACVVCGKPRTAIANARFSSSRGGLLCVACAAETPESRPAPEAVARGGRVGEAPAAWLEILDYHLTRVIGRPLRASRQMLRFAGAADKM